MVKKTSSSRIKIIQKIYGHLMNPDEVIVYPKSQYKKFIKDVVQGTIERKEYIEEILIKNFDSDINLKRTDVLLKIIIFAAFFEMKFKHKNPSKVIISEYLKTSEYFLENSQIKYLNAILDKISKKVINEIN